MSNMKTYGHWNGSGLDLDKFLNIGDAVDQEMADYFLNVLPPACWISDFIQIGEPHSHVQGRPTFSTIRRVNGQWIYCGHCWRGQHTEPSAPVRSSTRFSENEVGGAFDGFTVTSDADGGL